MRRIVVLFVSLSLLLSSFVVFAPTQAKAAAGLDCWITTFIYRNDSAVPIKVDLTLQDIPTVHQYSATRTLEPGETKDTTLYGFLTTGGGASASAIGDPGLTFVGFGAFGVVDDSNCLPSSIPDGRLNLYDIAAPLAAYCSNGGVSVWDIGADSQGTLAFSASLDAIHNALAQAQSSGQNVMIGQGLGNSLYALASNQLQFEGPDIKYPTETYQFIAPGDVCG